MKGRIVIGIDPGNNGGIAVYSPVYERVVDLIKMPPTPQELFNTLSEYTTDQYDGDIVCYLEKVGGMPGQGGSAMFNFGKGFGYLEMALIALKIPTVTITPAVWQKPLQLGTSKGMTKTQWKNKLKAKAEQLFPYISKVTLWSADALLICEYGRIRERE